MKVTFIHIHQQFITPELPVGTTVMSLVKWSLRTLPEWQLSPLAVY